MLVHCRRLHSLRSLHSLRQLRLVRRLALHQWRSQTDRRVLYRLLALNRQQHALRLLLDLLQLLLTVLLLLHVRLELLLQLLVERLEQLLLRLPQALVVLVARHALLRRVPVRRQVFNVLQIFVKVCT